MGNPETKVSMNRYALTSLVLHGERDAVENLLRETARTRKRLRKRGRGVKPLEALPRGAGGYPNYHDVVRWLDDLKNDELHESDVQFMLRVHVTAAERCRQEAAREA